MPETHYIEIDEEIISAVSRLRKSSDPENIFVLPKRALILQSIINLKLLGREAEKLGKTVIVMTQDEQGVRLAEKAGLRVQEYQDAVSREYRKEASARFTVRHGETIPMPESVESRNGLRRSNEIGSASFYGSAPSAPSPTPSPLPIESPSDASTVASPAYTPPKNLRVRNMTPPLTPALNSLRETPVSKPVVPVMPRQVIANNETPRTGLARKEKLRRLFEGRAAGKNSGGNPLAPTNPTPPSGLSLPPVSKSPHESSQTRLRAWLWSAGGGILLLLVVLGGYFFLRPEAILGIEPQGATQTVKLSLVASIDANAESSSIIPARYVIEEKTIRLSREATGKDLGNAAKATGIITILNTFSEAPQPLVATTRFELSDGKVYRLIDGITVPGTKTEDGKTVVGRIEARVIADSPGTSYNISSGSFTIPGFKGGPKFEKITAEVKTPFTGGGTGSETAATSVSLDDIERAKTAATEEARKSAIASIRESLQSGEIILEPSFQIMPVGTPSIPAVGTVANTFDYEGRFQVKGFVISESAVKRIIDKQTTESGGVVLRPHQYDVNYGAVLSNFETGRADLTVESKIFFRATLDEQSLKEGLLGLDEEGIRDYLAVHPEIKRLQVEFKPKIFIATIPNDPDRVTVTLLESTSE